ncbi:MAG: hypothetical protein AAFX03_08700 [Pseudomonadota bacterium]
MLGAGPPAAAQDQHEDLRPPKPLFASEDMLRLRIEGPISRIVRRAARSTEPHDAHISLPGTQEGTLEIKLAARGKSRRREDVCDFPPLRVRFPDRPDHGAFKGQKGLKLVTHCHRSDRRQHYVLMEYTAYRMLSATSPQSLSVRLAEIEYVEAGSDRVYAKRYGFFIEDADDTAKRNRMKEIDIPSSISLAHLSAEAAARLALFQFLIGNVDYSPLSGPAGADCCHNVKLMGAKKSSRDNLIPLPYDFDQTGIVDPPDPLFPENLSIKDHRDRLYRGFCVHNDHVRNEAANFLEQRGDIEAAFSGLPEIPSRRLASAEAFIADFFHILSDPDEFERQIIRKCR